MLSRLVKILSMSLIFGTFGLHPNYKGKSDTKIYTVRKGDTFFQIYKQYSSSLPFSEFKHMNKHLLVKNGSYERLDIDYKVIIKTKRDSL